MSLRWTDNVLLTEDMLGLRRRFSCYMYHPGLVLLSIYEGYLVRKLAWHLDNLIVCIGVSVYDREVSRPLLLKVGA